MSISIVRKSDPSKKNIKATKALILAGGALTGGSFKVGGLIALNDSLKRFQVTDFDLYVGISSGSLLAASLMAGVPPHSLLRSLDGTSEHFTRLRSHHFYRPNVSELFLRPVSFTLKTALWLPGKLLKLFRHSNLWSGPLLKGVLQFLQHPTLDHYDAMVEPVLEIVSTKGLPSLASLLPSGIFDNRPVEQYIRENIERNHLTNDFVEAYQQTGKQLYICAMELDGARRVVFGHDEENEVSISEAIMASTAVPGFYRPVRLQGVDYVDGGIQETADLDLAVEKGASLIVCYNPFRPYQKEAFVETFADQEQREEVLQHGGIMNILNQIFRTVFHERLHLNLKRLEQSRTFHGDVVVIEPRADDADFFHLNPFSFRHSIKAAKLGFESVYRSLQERSDELRSLFAHYGIDYAPEKAFREYSQLIQPGMEDKAVQRILEKRNSRSKKMKK